MKEVIMCASIITAIVLCFVGIIKLPFKTFKEKHPKWYRATFCIISLILAVGLPFIAQLYILKGAIYSVEFLVLILTTVAGVFGLYTSYEGLGLKSLVKLLVSKIAELFSKSEDKKIKAFVEKYGIDKLIETDNAIKEENAKKLAEEQEKQLSTEQTVEVKVEEVK